MTTSAYIFGRIGTRLQESPEKATSINAVFQFDLGEETWTLDLREGAINNRVLSGPAESPTVTITMTPVTWTGIFTGAVEPMSAFMTGKIKVKGDISKAMKLQSILALAK